MKRRIAKLCREVAATTGQRVRRVKRQYLVLPWNARAQFRREAQRIVDEAK